MRRYVHEFLEPQRQVKAQRFPHNAGVLKYTSAFMLLLGLTSGCVGDLGFPNSDRNGDPDKDGEITQEVVYGIDNRQDVFAHSDLSMRHTAQQAAVALISPGTINAS